MRFMEMKLKAFRWAETPSVTELRIDVRTDREEFHLKEHFPEDDFVSFFDRVWERAKWQIDEALKRSDGGSSCQNG